MSVEPALTRSSRISGRSARSWADSAVSPQSSSTMRDALEMNFRNLMYRCISVAVRDAQVLPESLAPGGPTNGDWVHPITQAPRIEHTK